VQHIAKVLLVLVLKKDKVPFQRSSAASSSIQQESRNLRETDLPPIDLNRIPRENCPRPKTFDMVSSGVAVAEAEARVSFVFVVAFAIRALSWAQKS